MKVLKFLNQFMKELRETNIMAIFAMQGKDMRGPMINAYLFADSVVVY